MSILFNGILWEKKMGRYVDNVNNYMAQMKIRQKYVSIKSGIDEKKLSRILKAGQKITGDEMEKIAYALGRNTEYFISEDFKVPVITNEDSMEYAFYVGTPSKKQEELAMKLIDLIENVDEILSIKTRFDNAFME